MPYVKTQDGTEIYFKDWGHGTPIVLIHGWPLNSDMWEHQATYLAENGYRVIAYDRRGFGKSSQPFYNFDYSTLSDDLAALMNALDLQDAVLVGFSMGGGEVVRYLSRHGSSRVRKAVLVSSVAPFMLKTDSNPDGTPEAAFDDFRKNLYKDRFDFLNEFGPKFYGRSVVHHTVSQPDLDWTFAQAICGSLKATVECLGSFSTTDFREEMKGLNIPFLVIHGTSDHTVPIDAAGRAAVKLLPHSTLIEYDGEPHGLFLTAKDRLNKDLLEFAGGERNAAPKLTTI